jgi:hypothetical protein
MSPKLELSGLPAPLRPINEAVPAAVGERRLSLRAGARTDWFIDPDGEAVVGNAPALVMPAAGDWMLRAHASATHAATFDAAVLVVRADDRTWAKLCLELAPDGRVMVVSVVTRGFSDDCNSVVVEGGATWLRVSRLGPAFAFHWSPDGVEWQMVRYFGLGLAAASETEVGFLAQSPTGDGCLATFEHVEFSPTRLADVRSGM